MFISLRDALCKIRSPNYLPKILHEPHPVGNHHCFTKQNGDTTMAINTAMTLGQWQQLV